MSAPTAASLELWQLCGYIAGKSIVVTTCIIRLNIFLAASWVIIVWDGVVTFGYEVTFIWPCVLLSSMSNCIEYAFVTR